MHLQSKVGKSQEVFKYGSSEDFFFNKGKTPQGSGMDPTSSPPVLIGIKDVWDKGQNFLVRIINGSNWRRKERRWRRKREGEWRMRRKKRGTRDE